VGWNSEQKANQLIGFFIWGITVSVSIKLFGTGYVDIYALFLGSQKAHPQVRPAFQNVDLVKL